ncbi:DUF413 domain-containing protein [Thalassotalea maritima]|uniref:DUF413 domain-containing protein n=1 Tax=Thalassotalea maritima TaxID=3242416 RepID=UPI003526EC67
MDTNIRKGKMMFYGDAMFSRGLSRSGYFNRREAMELEEYGHTFMALLDGSLTPNNDDEQRFVNEMQNSTVEAMYAVNLWRKYLDVIAKSKVYHGFAKSYAGSSAMTDFSL